MPIIKFTGTLPSTTRYVGLMQPGEEREVTTEVAQYLERGMFRVVKKPNKKETKKKEEAKSEVKAV